MTDNTVFDSAFKNMMNKEPRLVIPLINEAFGREYALDAPIVRYSNSHETKLGAIIDDSVFRVQDRLYHVECQSTPDSNMVVRMIEYDFAIALEAALDAGAPYEINFPESCVLFLRHTAATPDNLAMKVNLPNGESFEYSAKVVKAQTYSSEDIFEKRLLLLLPYYLMRYEKSLSLIASDDVRSAELIVECSELRNRLELMTLGSGDSLLYEELVELIIRVSDHLLVKHDELRKKVKRAMGGEVWELMHERAERLEREAREQGVAQGLEQGLEQGREQGIEQLAQMLQERGIDKDLVEQVAAEALPATHVTAASGLEE